MVGRLPEMPRQPRPPRPVRDRRACPARSGWESSNAGHLKAGTVHRGTPSCCWQLPVSEGLEMTGDHREAFKQALDTGSLGSYTQSPDESGECVYGPGLMLPTAVLRRDCHRHITRFAPGYARRILLTYGDRAPWFGPTCHLEANGTDHHGPRLVMSLMLEKGTPDALHHDFRRDPDLLHRPGSGAADRAESRLALELRRVAGRVEALRGCRLSGDRP